MALSGTINGTCDNSNYLLTCEWSATQNIVNNTSTITAKVYLKAPSGWSTDSSYWNVWINGTQITNDKSAVVGGTKVLLGQKTWTVTHTSTGTCSTTISFSYSNGLPSAGTYTTKKGSGNGSITLNTIPRTSSFTLSKSSMDMGASQTVNISSASSSFTHTVQYTFGKITTTLKPEKTDKTSVSFTPPVSLATEIPNSTSGTCTVKVTTYNGSTAIGSTTKTFTLTVPSSVKPTITLATNMYNSLSGLMLSGKSTIKITPTGTGSQGSTVSSYTYSGAGLSGTGSNKTTGTLNAGSYTVTVTVKDSRGRTNTASTSFTVYAYSAPTCSISAYRCNSDGTTNLSGTYAKLKLKWSLSDPNNTGSNAKKYTIEYKKRSNSSWITHTSNATLDSYSSTGTDWNITNVTFETTSSYEIKFTVTDSYSSATAVYTLSTINAILNMEKDGVGIGKIYERGKLDINGDTCITNGVLKFTNSPSMHSRIGYSLGTENEIGCTYISNGNNNWLRLNDDKTITYVGKDVLISGCTATGNLTMTGNIIANGYLRAEGNVWVKGELKFDTTNDHSRMGYNSDEKCTYISNEANNWLRLNDDGTMKWKGYLVHDGTSTSSDGRYKYILDNIKPEDCFNLVKTTNLYAYSLLDKSIDKYMNTTEISEELKKSSYMNIHMGIIAQEIEEHDLSRYILIKHKLNNDEYKYGIDNYGYVTAIHGALKHEISVREREIDGLKQQIKDLQQQIEQLSE